MTDDPNEGDAATTENTPDEERSITVNRVIEAPAERVYEAFLTPADIAVWAPPDGFRADVQEVEPEEGGSFRVENVGETEEMEQYSHTFQGTYQELKRGEKIVWTEDSGEGEDPSMVTVTLDAVPDGTEVTLRLDGIPQDVAEKYGVAEAKERSLEKLADQVEN
ncbi:SRPBCC domain-containing protein [Halorarum halophilum]|uniref:SRPBCC domain-containing protein n=1 Tax=Halorarum halophilum TaxID=2743090 RepID=A0A7D5GAQ8_9EURY|nr:SRPBCC domain-containing protein [Halobaculum halophilum]QLG26726.1 SRPBCC domain-containing protein [Halobaculum halophilum]